MRNTTLLHLFALCFPGFRDYYLPSEDFPPGFAFNADVPKTQFVDAHDSFNVSRAREYLSSVFLPILPLIHCCCLVSSFPSYLLIPRSSIRSVLWPGLSLSTQIIPSTLYVGEADILCSHSRPFFQPSWKVRFCIWVSYVRLDSRFFLVVLLGLSRSAKTATSYSCCPIL